MDNREPDAYQSITQRVRNRFPRRTFPRKYGREAPRFDEPTVAPASQTAPVENRYHCIARAAGIEPQEVDNWLRVLRRHPKSLALVEQFIRETDQSLAEYKDEETRRMIEHGTDVLTARYLRDIA